MTIANTTIQLKKSGVTGNVPSGLNYGELALNYYDGKLFYKNSGGSIVAFTTSSTANSFATINSNNSLVLATSPTDILSIAAGNNISITTNTTTKTITINSTAAGGGSSNINGIPATAVNVVLNSYTGDGTTTNFVLPTTPGSATNVLIDIDGITQLQSAYSISGNTITFTSPPYSGSTIETRILSNTIFVNTASYLAVTNTIPSTSNTTGAITVAGGVGVTGNVYADGLYVGGISVSAVDATQNTNISNVTANASLAFNQANTANALANLAIINAATAQTTAQGAFDNSNTKFSSSGGSISGPVTINADLTVSGNISYTGNVTSHTISGNTGQFFGQSSNGFNALYAGIPAGYSIEPQTIVQTTGNYNNYIQINLQNINHGNNASGDIVVTADNGNANDTYIDMGIGSSTYNQPGYGLTGPNDGYLYVAGNTSTGGGNLVLSTYTNKDIIFSTNGGDTPNEVMRINAANSVVIKSTNASNSVTTGALQVTGGVGIQGALYTSSINSNGVNLNAFTQAAYDTANAAVTSVSGTAGQIYSSGGKTPTVNLIATAVTSGVYGGSSQIPVVNVDQFGRIVSAANVSVSIPPGTAIFANSGQLTANSSTGNVAIGLATVGTAGVYGNTTSIPSITVDAYGRITSISNNSITTGGTTVTLSDTPPSSPTANSLWWNSFTGTLKVYYGSVWVDAVSVKTGPAGPAGPAGNSAVGGIYISNFPSGNNDFGSVVIATGTSSLGLDYIPNFNLIGFDCSTTPSAGSLTTVDLNGGVYV